jgi:hypothetical protein
MDKIKEIINKSELNQADMDFLMKNARLLSESDKIRLGFVSAPKTVEKPAAKVVKEEVVVEKPKRGKKAL